jgi:hypothetical protein
MVADATVLTAVIVPVLGVPDAVPYSHTTPFVVLLAVIILVAALP